jgi:opacity protein-like surface antigen
MAAPAVAGDRQWYVSLEGGVSDTAADGKQIIYRPEPPTLDEVFEGIGSLPLAPGARFRTFDRLESSEGAPLIATVGTRLLDNLSLELEVARRSVEVELADISQSSLMLNATYDVPLIYGFTLSLGAGAGLDVIEVDTPTMTASTTEAAFQLKAGLAFELSERTDIVLNYRYFTVGSAEAVGGFPTRQVGDTQLEDITDSSVSVGLRFGF